MRQILCAGVIALAAVIISATGPVEAQGVRRGANYFPNLPVVTQDGKTLKFYDDVIKGKRVLISFIYTNSPDIAPLTTARLTQLEDKLGDAFGVGHGWLFLTGQPEDIRRINASLGDRNRSLDEQRAEIVLGNDVTGE